MAPRIVVTENEILDELRASIGVEERKPGFYSVSELASQLKCAKNTVQGKLREWSAAGRLETATVVERRSSDGIRHRVKVYRLKAKR